MGCIVSGFGTMAEEDEQSEVCVATGRICSAGENGLET